MPYPIKNEGGKFCVNGKCYDSRDKALAYQRALYANVPDAKKKEMEDLLIVEGSKCWDDWDDDYWYGNIPKSTGMLLAPDDPRVEYDPLGGTRTKACANCAWFLAGEDACQLVSGPILPTGLSGLWLEKTKYEQPPIKVEVVNKENVSPVLAQAFLAQVKEMVLKITSGKRDDAEDKTDNGSDEADETDKGKKKKKFPFQKDEKEQSPLESGFKNLPDHKWVAWYTNNFQDKQTEIFPEQAHDRFISWIDSKELPMPELWFWHVPARAGQAEWIGRVDHIMMAVGSYDDTPIGRSMESHMTAHSKEYQTSHGYLFPSIGKKDGVYNIYATFEISPLPIGRESNPWTTFEEVKEMPIRPDKVQALERVLGKDLAAIYVKEAENRSAEIEKMGIQFKEVTDGALVDIDARSAVKEVADSQTQISNGMKELSTKFDQILNGIKGMQETEKTRDKKVDDLYVAVKEAFSLQASPRVANTTAIPEDNPLLVELKKKQLDGSAPQLGFFELFGLGAMANNPDGGK